MVISHFLIGPPSSGKSTLANQLQKLNPTARIVSTDAVRALLFGDESIQGDWSLIEANVLSQIREAFTAGQPVIYDATNVKREWRISLLERVADNNVQWIAWQLQTPLWLCQLWNKQRTRQVPETVIEEFFFSVQNSPPSVIEGFVAVMGVAVTSEGIDIACIERQLKSVVL